MVTYPVDMRSWPDMAALDLLVGVADHGSLSAAARSVGMAQPNATRSIARLERRLGLVLLHRSTHGSTLTASGLLVVEWARAVMSAAGQLLDGAASLADGAAGTFVVTASQTVAEHLLPRWLASLRASWPGTRIEVRVGNSTGTVDEVHRGVCDLGFIEGPCPPPGLHSLVVARDDLVLVVPPGHPWAGRCHPVGMEELAGTPLVRREPGSGTRSALDAALGRPAIGLLDLPSNAAVRVSVQSGTGPAVLSGLAVRDAVAAGALVEVPTTLDLRRDLRAVWSGLRVLQGPAADLVRLALAGTGTGPAMDPRPDDQSFG